MTQSARSARRSALLALLGGSLLLAGCAATPAGSAATPHPGAGAKSEPQWTPLFDGKTLGSWKVTQFGGEGEVAVHDGQLELPMGSPMTGVNWSGKPPATMDYEIQLQAMREEGHDFFCALTFPYGESPCTLVVGGWGGGVVGLSSLDGHDASENETSTVRSFDNKRWYAIRLRVTEAKIQAWIDGKQVVDAEVAGRKVGIRPEVDLCRPLGIATYSTTAQVRQIQLRKLGPAELK